MSELQTTKITDRAGTGSPNFSQGLKISGTDSGLLAPTRTEGNTEPSTPANGDTWYDTDNDTYDVYINDEWKRFIGAGGGSGWTADLSNASYDSVSFSFSGQSISPYGLAFNTDGTKMYVVNFTGSAVDGVFQYSLSTGFDLSTASYSNVSFSVNSQDAIPVEVTFSSDGTKMYIIGYLSNSVHQYTLSTGFDLSTASYDSVSFSVNSQDVHAYGLAFNTDGTKMYMVGVVTDAIYQYSLTTGFNVGTASYDSVSLSVNSQDTTPVSLKFNTDGTKMYLLGDTNDSVYQYSLSTGFDLSTASYDSSSFSVSSQDGSPYAVGFNTDGTKMYVIGITNNVIYQYSTGS